MHIFETLITLIEINATKLMAILNKKQTLDHTFYKKNVNQFAFNYFVHLNKITNKFIKCCLSTFFIKIVTLHKYTLNPLSAAYTYLLS